MYQGYTARYEFEEEGRVWHGWVDGIDDVVTFESETLDGLEREFQISVDVYLEVCAEHGEEQDRPNGAPRQAS